MSKQKVSLNPGDAKHVPTWEDALALPLPDVDIEYIPARSSIRNLEIAVRVLSRESGLGVGETYRRLTWLGAVLAKSEKILNTLDVSLKGSDDACLALVESVSGDIVGKVSYCFRSSVPCLLKIPVWDKPTKNYLSTVAEACGVNCYSLTMIYVAKAIVDSGVNLHATRAVFDSEFSIWYGWLNHRKELLDKIALNIHF